MIEFEDRVVENNVFVDDKNLITWVRYHKNNPKCKDFNKELRVWSDDEGIRDFILVAGNLDEMFMTTKKFDDYDREDFYYATQDNVLLGCVYITRPAPPYLGSVEFDYLVVNPRLRHQGIGTRMINSVTRNVNWFARNTFKEDITTLINEKNYNSKNAFLKCNYKVVKDYRITAGHGEKHFEKFYFRPRQIENEEDKEKE